MRALPLLFLICVIGLQTVIGDTETNTTQESSNIYHEGNENQETVGVRQKRAIDSTTIADLASIKDLNVVGFYVALRELYLTGGFSLNLNFNIAILKEAVIPDMIYQEVIRSLEQTKWELRNGDATYERINGMIKLNEPDSLIHEPWLIDLISLIMEKSLNPKNVAHSIRDLGIDMIEKNFSRIGYTNGNDLRKFLNNWQSTELSGEGKTEQHSGFNWTETFVLIHHSIGPENFNELGDILESMPWNIIGMFNGDSEFLRLYKHRLIEAIVDADLAVRMLSSLEDAFQKATETIDKPLRIIDRLVQSEIIPSAQNSIFIGDGGSSIPSDSTSRRLLKSQEDFSKIWEEVKNEEMKKKFSEVVKNSDLKSLELIKNALVSGSRLVKNLGSTEKAIEKCDQLKQMSDFDSMGIQRINYALEIVKKLNGTLENGTTGFELLFSLYSNSKPPLNQFLFMNSRSKTKEEMKELFKAVELSTTTGFFDLLTRISKEKCTYSSFQRKMSSLENNETIEREFRRQFGFSTNQDNGLKLRSALQAVLKISQNTNQYDYLDYIRSIRAIYKTQNPSQFLMTLSSIADLSRDHRWLDVYDSLELIYSMTTGPSSSFSNRAAPFFNLSVNGSYSEVLYSFQSLLEHTPSLPPKCKFISDFFTGLDDVDSVIKSIGIVTKDIQRWNFETISTDSLIQLLRSSGSRANLARLLGFHGKHTTNSDFLISIELIGDLLVYFAQNGWY